MYGRPLETLNIWRRDSEENEENSEENEFRREWIPKRMNSEENEFRREWMNAEENEFWREWIPKRMNSEENEFRREWILKRMNSEENEFRREWIIIGDNYQVCSYFQMRSHNWLERIPEVHLFRPSTNSRCPCTAPWFCLHETTTTRPIVELNSRTVLPPVDRRILGYMGYIKSNYILK